MNFQDILKIKRANTKVLFCNELIEPPIPRNELIDAQTVIKQITNKNIIYQNGQKSEVDDSVRDKKYVAKYSRFDQIKTLLRDKKNIKDVGKVKILSGGKREYTATPSKESDESNKPVIYFWINGDTIFYVGKAGNGWSNRSKQHQNGWNRKAEEERISKNRLLLENIFPEHPTGFNLHHGFAVLTIPVNQLTINYPEQLEALSPFKNIIPPVSVNIIDELEKIFIFICQPQINTTLKNGDGVNFERLTEIIRVAGD